MTTGQWLTSGGLLTLGGLAGFYAGWVVRGSYRAEVLARVVNKHDNELAEHGERIREIERRMAA